MSFSSFNNSSVTLGSWAITVPPQRQSSKIRFAHDLAPYRVFPSRIIGSFLRLFSRQRVADTSSALRRHAQKENELPALRLSRSTIRSRGSCRRNEPS